MLHETLRPKDWSEVLAQPEAVALCRSLARKGAIGGKAFWITGQSGTGKTTIARLLAAEIADDRWGSVVEVNAGSLSPESIREIRDTHHYYGGGKGGRAVIVNEAHGLRGATMRECLVAMEPIPSHVVWVFTTTCEGEERLFDAQDDASPLVSRCIPIALSRRNLAGPFADLLLDHARKLGLCWTPEKCHRVVKDCRNNLRMALGELEAAALVSECAA